MRGDALPYLADLPVCGACNAVRSILVRTTPQGRVPLCEACAGTVARRTERHLPDDAPVYVAADLTAPVTQVVRRSPLPHLNGARRDSLGRAT